MNDYDDAMCITELREKIDRLNEHIEELKKERDFYHDRACNGTPEATGTWVRYERINAAVVIAEKDRSDFGSKAVWYALNTLGFFQDGDGWTVK